MFNKHSFLSVLIFLAVSIAGGPSWAQYTPDTPDKPPAAESSDKPGEQGSAAPAEAPKEAAASHAGHEGHDGGETSADSPFPHRQAGMDMPGMSMDEKGAVMNENKDELPKDCPKVSEDIRIEVHAGRKFASKFNGLMYSFDQHEWRATPCSRVTVRFVNDDKVRHQWMIHGLPKYIYPAGMFHLEVTGPGEKTGTFILPNIERTYFVHCDIAQHMEKGMKAQVKVGKGSGDLPSIPGISGQIYPDRYDQLWSQTDIAMVIGAGLLGLFGAGVGLRRIARSRNT